jgi:ketosteroid isomerase-like protein
MPETGTGPLAGPREAFELHRARLLAEQETGVDYVAMLAEDVVGEVPFAPPGEQRRFEGRGQFGGWARALSGRVRFTDVRDVVVHETADPEVAVVEYTVEGVREAGGVKAAVPFVLVVRVRDGRVVLWREYQDPAAMALLAGNA